MGWACRKTRKIIVGRGVCQIFIKSCGWGKAGVESVAGAAAIGSYSTGWCGGCRCGAGDADVVWGMRGDVRFCAWWRNVKGWQQFCGGGAANGWGAAAGDGVVVGGVVRKMLLSGGWRVYDNGLILVAACGGGVMRY